MDGEKKEKLSDEEMDIVAPPNPKMVERLAAMRHKFDSAKLRDMLREKCRIRVKQCREKQYNLSRNFLAEEKNWLSDVLKLELKELEDNILLEDILYEELVNESYRWLVEEYERELEYLASKDPNETNVVCPICQKFDLTLTNGNLICECGINFKWNQSLAELSQRLQNMLTEHGNKCNACLLFFIEPNTIGEPTLSTCCDQCDFFASTSN